MPLVLGFFFAVPWVYRFPELPGALERFGLTKPCVSGC